MNVAPWCIGPLDRILAGSTASLVRRIVPFVEEGQPIGIGERLGLIRFGSRVDIYLPENTGIMVAVGQRAIAGETVIADLKGTEQDREARLS